MKNNYKPSIIPSDPAKNPRKQHKQRRKFCSYHSPTLPFTLHPLPQGTNMSTSLQLSSLHSNFCSLLCHYPPHWILATVPTTSQKLLSPRSRCCQINHFKACSWSEIINSLLSKTEIQLRTQSLANRVRPSFFQLRLHILTMYLCASLLSLHHPASETLFALFLTLGHLPTHLNI